MYFSCFEQTSETNHNDLSFKKFIFTTHELFKSDGNVFYKSYEMANNHFSLRELPRTNKVFTKDLCFSKTHPQHMILRRNIENYPFLSFLILTPDFPNFYYMLGGNLGSRLYGDVSVMLSLAVTKSIFKYSEDFENLSFNLFQAPLTLNLKKKQH